MRPMKYVRVLDRNIIRGILRCILRCILPWIAQISIRADRFLTVLSVGRARRSGVGIVIGIVGGREAMFALWVGFVALDFPTVTIHSLCLVCNILIMPSFVRRVVLGSLKYIPYTFEGLIRVVN